jgi:rhodanese-related sulfurtransferase
MIQAMTTEQLEDLMERAEDFLLVDVLPRQAFYDDHIDGSRCIPLDEQGFVTSVANAVAGKRNKKIVVYCGSDACDASTRAAGELESAGFTNVFDYKGGMEAWHRSAQPRKAPSSSPSDDSARPMAEKPAQSAAGALGAADASAARDRAVQLGATSRGQREPERSRGAVEH